MFPVFKDLDFSNITVVFLLLTVIIFFRYLVFSTVYYSLFFILLKNKITNRIINPRKPKIKQIKTEIYWSAISGVIFAAVGVIMYFLYINGHSTIYMETSKNSIWYIPLSIFIFLFAQDTYYYWAHRWMHLPKIYKYFHLVHHKSIHTSVFTAFSFHPLETIIQALFLPIIIIILPIHFYTLLATLLIMTVSATINHAGIEIYPSGKFGDWLKKRVIGATHHDFHHRKFNYNYGLYFTFWDRTMKTEFYKKKS
ncbi:sterol desaturase family protein [Polaribacter sp. ALD11]|uniref:sterol desaturase family protein n=1 Tax=Polaribacter sp. ALD11 TaxID=2058137 RepID=UPI000C31507B|nr:sterol desaturase family protein [Polaribacter sp. ALD11]AUC85846.1 sterol desaturase family protein [Polaribacter sp. ALD11]